MKIIETRIKRLKRKDLNLTNDELVKAAIEGKAYKYYYHGVALKDYCYTYNLSYNLIKDRISHLKKENQNLTNDELVKLAIEGRFHKYYYHGILLSEYCRTHDLEYETIRNRIKSIKKRNKDLDNDEAVRMAIEEFKRYKYYYQGTLLANYCSQNSINYNTIWDRIINLKAKNLNLSEDELVVQAIKDYNAAELTRKRNKIFKDLGHENSIDKLKEYCQFLKISFTNVESLVKKGFTYQQAINMIWYFSDITNEVGNKCLTEAKLKYIMELQNQNKSELDYPKLLALYKCQLCDTRVDMLKQEKSYFNSMIYKICQEYNMMLTTDQYTEILNEIEIKFLNLIENTSCNIETQMITYLNKSIRGYVRIYLSENIIDLPVN